MLFNYGSKLTQDQELLKDCIHDVFIKVYSKRDERNSINNFGSYLIISLKNRLLDEFRRHTFTTEDAVEDFEYRYSTADVEHDYLSQEKQDIQSITVAHLMQNLTRRQRQAITLYYGAEIRGNLRHHANELPLRPQPDASWYGETPRGSYVIFQPFKSTNDDNKSSASSK